MAGRLDTRWVSEERRRPCSILWPDRTEQGRAGGQPARKPGQEAWTGGAALPRQQEGPAQATLWTQERQTCRRLPGATATCHCLGPRRCRPFSPGIQFGPSLRPTKRPWRFCGQPNPPQWPLGGLQCVISGYPLHQQGTGVRSKQQPPPALTCTSTPVQQEGWLPGAPGEEIWD